MSSKNQLQEMYPRQHITYHTSLVGGPPHRPEFQSIVVLPNNQQIQGNIAYSRVEAEKSAALLTLSQINGPRDPMKIPQIPQIPERKRVVSSDVPCIFLVDLENISKGVNVNEIEIEPNVIVIGFLKYNHPLVDKKSSIAFPIELVHSTHKDASDLQIVIRATIIAESGRFQKLVIITRDHFAFTLKDLFSNLYKNLDFQVWTSFFENS